MRACATAKINGFYPSAGQGRLLFLRLWKMRQWHGHGTSTGLEGIVANKDKGGKSNKKTPSKNLKEKRQEKKAKRDASDKRQSKIT